MLLFAADLERLHGAELARPSLSEARSPSLLYTLLQDFLVLTTPSKLTRRGSGSLAGLLTRLVSACILLRSWNGYLATAFAIVIWLMRILHRFCCVRLCANWSHPCWYPTPYLGAGCGSTAACGSNSAIHNSTSTAMAFTSQRLVARTSHTATASCFVCVVRRYLCVRRRGSVLVAGGAHRRQGVPGAASDLTRVQTRSSCYMGRGWAALRRSCGRASAGVWLSAT